MCDLHQMTLSGQTPTGAIPMQIDWATGQSGSNQWIKLYNSGNFFDPLSIPPDDYSAIAERLRGYDRVIVENHPRFGKSRLGEFRSMFEATLEIAVGLETVQPRWLRRLSKQMTRDDFDQYAHHLLRQDVALRVFLIVGSPGVSVSEALRWAMLSVRHAALQGARHLSLIPARVNAVGPSQAGLVEAPVVNGLESHQVSTTPLVLREEPTSGEGEQQPVLEPGSPKERDSDAWGLGLGALPCVEPCHLLELQQRAIRELDGSCMITVDLWDLDSNDDTVRRMSELNLSQTF